MAASDSSDEEEDEQLSNSGDENEDGSSSDGSSDGTSSSDEEDSEGDSASEAVDEEDEDELKQARVRSDIQETRLMVGEMEKIKQRLLFRLEREKQAKLEEANWQLQQQQRLAEEEKAQRRQQQEEEAERKVREESKIAQESVAQQQQQQQSSPERSIVEIGVQTELSTASVEYEDRLSHNAPEQASHSLSASTQRRTGTVSKQTSVPIEGQSARLSLYDLGKSYGMQETAASPATKQELHQQQQQQQQLYESAPDPPVSASRNASAAPSEASDSDTFFIRRDSNRTSWQSDIPNHHNDSFRRSQGSVLDSEYGSEDERVGSPTSQTGARTSKSAFQMLRNSILPSIHEGTSDNAVGSNRSAASVEFSKLFESQQSRFGHSNLSDNDNAAKTDEQREQEAIQSLLFER